MSYARFGWDNSDVYVFEHVSGFIQCCGCHLTKDNPDELFGFADLKTARLALEHLDEHVKAGDTVPASTFERIKEDHPDLDAEIQPYEREKSELDDTVIKTETGSVYEFRHGVCTKRDSHGRWLDVFKVFYITGVSPDTKTMDGIFESISNGTLERRLPKVGERMYVSGRDGWWLSTPVVSIKKSKK